MKYQFENGEAAVIVCDVFGYGGCKILKIGDIVHIKEKECTEIYDQSSMSMSMKTYYTIDEISGYYINEIYLEPCCLEDCKKTASEFNIEDLYE